VPTTCRCPRPDLILHVSLSHTSGSSKWSLYFRISLGKYCVYFPSPPYVSKDTHHLFFKLILSPECLVRCKNHEASRYANFFSQGRGVGSRAPVKKFLFGPRGKGEQAESDVRKMAAGRKCRHPDNPLPNYT